MTIYLNDYRKFSSARQIALSSLIVVKKGNLQPVIPNERKSCAGNISSSGFFVSIRLKEGVSCSYDEALNFKFTADDSTGSSSDGTSLQWGLNINAQKNMRTTKILLLYC